METASSNCLLCDWTRESVFRKRSEATIFLTWFKSFFVPKKQNLPRQHLVSRAPKHAGTNLLLQPLSLKLRVRCPRFSCALEVDLKLLIKFSFYWTEVQTLTVVTLSSDSHVFSSLLMCSESVWTLVDSRSLIVPSVTIIASASWSFLFSSFLS